MLTLSQSPTDPAFVQDPYPFYARARAEGGDFVFWSDYDMPCAVSHRAVGAILKDRRLGREIPADKAPAIPPHLAPFYAIEAHSMLEREPPVHTRLRGLVLRAFTSRRIAALAPDITALADRLIGEFPQGEFDLLTAFAQPLPVIVIARLLGVPETDAPDLLRWSNAMVAMYQARRTPEIEAAAATASAEFTAYLSDYIATRRSRPGDDLISELIAAEQDGERLSRDEMISTCVLLLNAGHEATVHTMGNGVKALLAQDHRRIDAATIEEILRYDPPLHMFTRWAYEDVEICGQTFAAGQEIAALLGAAGRDPAAYADPDRFDPARTGPAHHAFGAGIHFCVGAPLARLELQIGLERLFATCPNLALAATPRYADLYHFHGLTALRVTT